MGDEFKRDVERLANQELRKKTDAEFHSKKVTK